MTLADQYRFYIDIPLKGEVQVYPCNDSITWKQSQYKDECFFRKELETALIFNSDNYFADFWAAEQDRCRCNVWPIRIEEKCCSLEYEEVFTGTLNFVDGDWNPELCEVAIKPRVQDEWSCMLRTWKDKKNYLTLDTEQSVSNIFGIIVCEWINYPLSIDLFDFADIDAEAISIYNRVFVDANGFTGGNTYSIGDIELIRVGQQYQIRYERCQECSDVQPPNTTGWTFDGTQWCRPSEPSLGLTSGAQWYANVATQFTTNPTGVYFDYENREKVQLDNGILFKDLIEFYTLDCFDCVISNFFDVNSDGTAPNNSAYQRAAFDYHNILAFQTSDMVNPDAPDAFVSNTANPAGLLSWYDLWQDLKKLNLCMEYDKDTGCLRIEHVSYFAGRNNKLLNLTHKDYVDCLRGKMNYSVNSDDVPLFERLKYSIESPYVRYSDADDEFGTDYPQAIEFNDGSIQYDFECSDPDDDTNDRPDEVCQFESMVNDLGYYYKNERYFTDENVLRNITLVSTRNGVIVQGAGNRSGIPTLNSPWSATHIIANYWLWDRPQCRGMINGRRVNTDFITVRKIRKLPSIDIFLTCEVINQLDTFDEVKTVLGLAQIDEITYEFPSGNTSLSLLV